MKGSRKFTYTFVSIVRLGADSYRYKESKMSRACYSCRKNKTLPILLYEKYVIMNILSMNNKIYPKISTKNREYASAREQHRE